MTGIVPFLVRLKVLGSRSVEVMPLPITFLIFQSPHYHRSGRWARRSTCRWSPTRRSRPSCRQTRSGNSSGRSWRTFSIIWQCWTIKPLSRFGHLNFQKVFNLLPQEIFMMNFLFLGYLNTFLNCVVFWRNCIGFCRRIDVIWLTIIWPLLPFEVLKEISAVNSLSEKGRSAPKFSARSSNPSFFGQI